MNVSKIRILSRQYEALSKFHKVCCQSEVELSAKSSSAFDQELDPPTTQLIIAQLRGCINKELAAIMEDIKGEAR